ncbi:hypothetical protein [Alicyclobacillus acidiphilus]|uniref:hypothetical protein n=1 Tax=Alicyclobacillus acidiphilus TaxID=182455 RepID=UPI000832F7E4|nr:hypothetical protein [Alicyclobacillus acidiphilus]
MGFYKTDEATFDIHETDNGKCAVILAPDLDNAIVGTGKPLATFDTPEEARRFCDNWKKEQ